MLKIFINEYEIVIDNNLRFRISDLRLFKIEYLNNKYDKIVKFLYNRF